MATVGDKNEILINGYLREFAKNNKLSNTIPYDINNLIILLFPIIGIGSKMLTNDENEQLMKWIDKSKQCEFKLLFKATRDGFASTEFHKKCDDKGTTITIVKSDNEHIFGGFSSKSWNRNGWIADDFAWLYLLKSTKSTSKKFKIGRYQSNAMLGRTDYGPTFGGGHDLCIATHCNKNNYSYTQLGHSYGDSRYGSDSHRLNGGIQNFKVLDYEVWQIVKRYKL